MDRSDSNGHTLGGEGPPARSSEVRERRVLALGGGDGGSNNTLKTPPPNLNPNIDSSANSANSHQPPINAKQTSDDDDDVDLQAALALSMGQTDIATSTTTEPMLDAQATINKSTSHHKADNAVDEELVENWWNTGTPFEISSFHEFMWDTGLTTDNDKSRWVGQGIDFRDEDAETAQVPHGVEEGTTMVALLTKDHGPWGLVQSHGGPCGVLAAVQAELLRLLLFGRRTPSLDYPKPLEPGTVPAQAVAFLSPELVRQALALAVAIILARSAVAPSAATGETTGNEKKTVKIVLPPQSSDPSVLTWEDLEPWSASSDAPTQSTTLSTYTICCSDAGASSSGSHKRQKINGMNGSREDKILRLARAAAAFLLCKGPSGRAAPLDFFRRPGGIMLMVMSLFATRGKEIIQGEMDDPSGTKLTSQFGHCGQELINLLLTGQGVSNVFDNTLKPSGELTCRGIQARPDIGYLSQLESLRYCEVGGYYKSPRYPIWVVGSTSHFTVLFGDSSCLKESESDLLLEKCRRAFKAVEGGEENGFISSSNLGAVLKSLGVNLDENYSSTLAASLEVSDAGIILWDDFWKATSRLMTGATIEQVLHDAPVAGTGIANDVPPLLLTQHGEPAVLDQDLDRKPSAKNPKSVESDEEMARKLSTQWDLENTNSSPNDVATAAVATASSSAAATPMEVEPATMSDEELARKLQAEWDAEVSGTASSSVAAVNGSQGSPQWSNFPDTNSSIGTPDMTPMSMVEDSNPQDSKDQPHKLDFERYGETFQLYHYNGLRGGTLTPFRVTRLSAEEAVGASIALNRGNNSHSGGSGDLEDVVRTKWPSCMINWLGKRPPYID